MHQRTAVTVGMLVDYDSPLARRVSKDVWAELSRTALNVGFTKSTALWKSVREERGQERPDAPPLNVFIIGQDRPEEVDTIGAICDSSIYGLVVAVPNRTSPLAGSLLYQGVERLTGMGVRAGRIEPALLNASSIECGAYARHLIQRFLETFRK